MLVLLIAISTLRVDIHYVHNGDDDELNAKFVLWKIIRYSLKVPVIAIDKETATVVFEEEEDSAVGHKEKKDKMSPRDMLYDIKQFQRFLKHVVGFHTIVRHFLMTVSVNRLSWKSVIGTTDASLSGSISGLLWAVKGNVVGVIGNYMRMRTLPYMAIQPVYNMVISRTELKCMITFRMGHAIIAAIKVVRHWRKGKPLLPSQKTEKGRDMNV